MFGTSCEHHPNPVNTLLAFIAVEQKGRLFRGGGIKPPPFAELCAVVRMIAQLPFHIEKERRGENTGLCAFIFKMTQFFFAEEGLLLNSVQWFLVIFFFGPVLFSSNFISFNRLAPNLHQHHTKELGLRKQTRQRLNSLWWAFEFSRLCPGSWWFQRDGPCAGLGVGWFAFECRGGLSMAPATGRNAASPCACKRGWFHTLFRDRA